MVKYCQSHVPKEKTLSTVNNTRQPDEFVEHENIAHWLGLSSISGT